jgi:hypothetical protein
MAKKPPRHRTLRRAAAQSAKRLEDKLDRLGAELPGGSAERPLTVASASVVEVRARAARCLVCEGEMAIRAHDAAGSSERPLRRIDLVCASCRRPRSLWFRIEQPAPN